MTVETNESQRLVEQARMQLQLSPKNRERLEKNKNYDVETVELCIKGIGEKTVEHLSRSNHSDARGVLEKIGETVNTRIESTQFTDFGDRSASMIFSSNPSGQAGRVGTLANAIGKGEWRAILDDIKIREGTWGVRPDGTVPDNLQRDGYIPTEQFLAGDKTFLAKLRLSIESRKDELAQHPTWNVDRMIREMDQTASEGGKFSWDKDSGQYIENQTRQR